jgi:hypothetical protein
VGVRGDNSFSYVSFRSGFVLAQSQSLHSVLTTEKEGAGYRESDAPVSLFSTGLGSAIQESDKFVNEKPLLCQKTTW